MKRPCMRLGCRFPLPPGRVRFHSDECAAEAHRAFDALMRRERYREDIKVDAARLDAHRRQARDGMRALRARRAAAGLTATGQPRRKPCGS